MIGPFKHLDMARALLMHCIEIFKKGFRHCHFDHGHETIARMSSVLIANLKLDRCSETNPLTQQFGKKNIVSLMGLGVGKLLDIDDTEIARREEIDYRISVEDESDDDNYEVDDDIL